MLLLSILTSMVVSVAIIFGFGITDPLQGGFIGLGVGAFFGFLGAGIDG